MSDQVYTVAGASFQWDGLNNVVRRLELLTRTLPPRLAVTLYQRVEAVMTLSKGQFVPVDEGFLRNSGYVDQPIVTPGRISVTLGYGGASAPYARYQHENLDLKHTVGGPKYLERPLYQSLGLIKAAIGATVVQAARESAKA